MKVSSPLRMTGFLDGANKVFTIARKSARIYDVSSGRELRTISTEADMLSGGVSPDSKWLVTGGDDGMARVWDLSTGQQLVEKKHPGKVYFAAFLPGGGAVLTVPIGKIAKSYGFRSAIYLWDRQTGMDIAHWKAIDWESDPEDHHIPAAFSQDGTRTAGAFGGGVGVRSVATDRLMATMETAGERSKQPVGLIRSLTFSPNGSTLIACGMGGAGLWSTEQGGTPLMSIGDGADCGQAAFSPDGAVVLTSSNDEVAAYNVKSGDLLLSVHSASAKVNGFPVLAFSPDGHHFAAGFPHSDLTIVWEVTQP